MQMIPVPCINAVQLYLFENVFGYLQRSSGRAMAQAVSRWHLTAEARVRARVNPCGICGGQSGTGQVFSEYFGFPCKYHYTIAPYSFITAP
jgi:hypothetical protein